MALRRRYCAGARRFNLRALVSCLHRAHIQLIRMTRKAQRPACVCPGRWSARRGRFENAPTARDQVESAPASRGQYPNALGPTDCFSKVPRRPGPVRRCVWAAKPFQQRARSPGPARRMRPAACQRDLPGCARCNAVRGRAGASAAAQVSGCPVSWNSVQYSLAACGVMSTCVAGLCAGGSPTCKPTRAAASKMSSRSFGSAAPPPARQGNPAGAWSTFRLPRITLTMLSDAT